MLPKFITEKEILLTPLIVQGSKAKLIPFLLRNIHWNFDSCTYYECFLGSGIVALNIQPKKAVLSDVNPHLIRFFKDLQDQTYSLTEIAQFLTDMKPKLTDLHMTDTKIRNRNLMEGECFYYTLRKEFNQNPNSLLFLVLNMTCINNLMRFNAKGEFNAPYLFDQKRGITNLHDIKNNYIKIILNRIQSYIDFIHKSDITFLVKDFTEILKMGSESDFYYFDPPYFARNTQYYSEFSESQNQKLIEFLNQTKSGFAYSNWYSDDIQLNPYISQIQHCVCKKMDHYYLIGNSQRDTRQKIVECVLISQNANVNQSIGIKKWL